MCAMSVMTSAPTWSAIARTRAKSNDARIRAGADHDHLRPVLAREPVELVVVEPLVALADAVRHDREELAGEVQRMAVREMAAVREVHPEDGVARLEHGEVDGHVRLRAGMRLHVDVLGAEQLLRALDRQRLGDVDELTAAVVALARIAFGVLVRHHRAGGFQHREADEILRRDELEALFLAADLVPDGGGDLRIGLSSDDSCGISSAAILSTRRWWRPPANGVSMNAVTMRRGFLRVGDAVRRARGRWRRCARG